MKLTLTWNNNYAIADEQIDFYVAMLMAEGVNNCMRSVGNMLLVDAFRVQRKLGNLSELYLNHGTMCYGVDDDGRWLTTPPAHLFAVTKYLMQLL